MDQEGGNFNIIAWPDKEVELEEEVKSLNNAFYKAVREIRKFYPNAHNTGVMPMHRLFLERYEYFDFGMGHTAYHLRVIKLVSLYFANGGPNLNKVGLYHLRSYVLQELGFLSGVNSWEGLQNKREPEEIQENKRAVWLQTREAARVQELDNSVETDLEDEFPVMVVPDSQSDSPSGRLKSLADSSRSIPVYVQGQLVHEGDIRLQQNRWCMSYVGS